jgi:tyrosyl-tRNA synthetase
MEKNLFQILKERGYIYQATNEEKIKETLNGERITFYLGIDPTADSLHIGHFFALMLFRYLQDAGHRGILVIGGATALIGDPSGKSDMRKMLSKEEVNHNLEEVKTLAKRFIKTEGENPALILSNEEWMKSYNFVDFMRDIGVHFNINKMLSTEIYDNRLKEGGLTFLEMGYMLMQSYDFVYLNKKYGCSLQIGGSDQWGNITAGVNLLRKMNFKNDEAADKIYGLTCPLLMTKEGKKMGKTENGTLWVARERTTVFDFFQYFYNVMDEDTTMLLKLFTRLPLDEIEYLVKNDIIAAKKTMAYEITKLVHGKDEADKVIDAVDNLFNNSDSEHMPKIVLNKSFMENGINIVDILTITKFVLSKSEAKRLIEQGGICVDNEKISDIKYIINTKQNHLILKRGKKNFLKVIFE